MSLMSSTPSTIHNLYPLHPMLLPDILEEVTWHADAGDLFNYALVNRQWTHSANARLYRHVQLRGRRDIARFFKCLMHRTIAEQGESPRASIMRTLHVQLTETSDEAPVRPLNREAYQQLVQLFPRLVNLTRLLLEVYIGFNFEDYHLMESWLFAMPVSLRVCMIRLADGHGIYISNERRWARLIRFLECTTLVLISNPPIFHPETCDSQLPELLNKAMLRGERRETSQPISLSRIEIWTSIHKIVWTKGLYIERIIHHTDVPEWDDYYCYAAQWDGENSQWEFQQDRESMQSSLPGMVPERCPGATVINPFDPTRGTCEARNSFRRWVVCDDGTICRREDMDKPRLESDWVKWEDNSFGRRALGMYVPLKR
ncbi:hypothetical protein HWV62_19301 [Athelia sp. TMB]|nr:hypothetical protein HWV62_19301 [Athelia sp. TMB]